MRPTFRVFLLAVSAASGLGAQASRTPTPRELFGRTVTAMGDATVLESLATMRVDGIQHEYLLDNAERAGGGRTHFDCHGLRVRTAIGSP